MAHEQHTPALHGIMAEFETPTALVEATTRARLHGFRNMDAYTPIPIEELNEALGLRRTRLPRLVLLGGILGGLGGFGLEYWASTMAYPMNVGGRPLNSWPHFIPVMFETTVLGAALTCFVGMWALNKLPQPYHPVFNVPAFDRASTDRFFLCIEATDPRFDAAATRAFLETLHPVEYPTLRRKEITRALVVVTAVLAVAGCRQDMHDAPSYDPLQATTFFPDGSASRTPVANTVARGQLREDDHLEQGRVDGRLASTFPMPVTAQVMARGQERFNVFCAPCHGKTGVGNGMVVQRGFRAPPSFQEERLRNAPAGYFFDVMTNGFGAMLDYSAQVTPEDRWAIAAYIRALQLSGNARIDDVPAARRAELDQPAAAGAAPEARFIVDTTYTPPADLEAVRSRALQVGIAGLVVCAIGFVVARDHFFRAWLVAFLLWLGVAMGSLGLMMIQHLSGGSWGVFRRIFEAASRTIPLMGVLFLPVFLGMGTLYPWTHTDHVAADEIMRHKAPYLNVPFFIGRAVFYFVGWSVIALTLSKWSKRQDDGEMAVNLPIQRLSGFGLVFYALTMTFAGIDWIMSINPHWYSTLFGFLMLGGQGLSALAFTIITSRFLSQRAPMQELLKPNHFHDLGKLSLAFVMLWAYFNFSQFLLTYAANLIEELPYFLARTDGGWQYLAIFLVLFHFFVPFFMLLSRDNKRASTRLVVIACWILFVRYVDIYMLVSPEFAVTGANLHLVEGEQSSRFFVHWLDVAATAAIGGLWVWMFTMQLAQRPLLAFRDPYLHEALQSSGGH